jgi:DNA-binding transcriptional ArsR family regulator
MGVWLVGADVVATSRFAISPMAETLSALRTLAEGGPQLWERSWHEAHSPAFRRRVAGDPFAHALLNHVLGRGWLPNFMAAPPATSEPSFADELARVRESPPATVFSDLAVPLGPAPLPSALGIGDPAGAVADLLAWVWDHTLVPDWGRRRSQLHADIVSRTARVARHGWAAALEDLGPQVRWLGDGRLQINTTARPPRDLAGAELVLVASRNRRSWVSWDAPQRYALVYPASGQLLDPAGTQAPAAIRALLGATRADLLARLGKPASTTHIAVLTGLALGTVGHHLRVLHNAGLVDRRRTGATVLYYRSMLGDSLLNRKPDESPPPPPSL